MTLSFSLPVFRLRVAGICGKSRWPSASAMAAPPAGSRGLCELLLLVDYLFHLLDLEGVCMLD